MIFLPCFSHRTGIFDSCSCDLEPVGKHGIKIAEWTVGREKKSDALAAGADGRGKNESYSFLVNFLVMWPSLSNAI